MLPEMDESCVGRRGPRILARSVSFRHFSTLTSCGLRHPSKTTLLPSINRMARSRGDTRLLPCRRDTDNVDSRT